MSAAAATAPRPLPAHSRALRLHRYEVNVLGPRNERGGYPVLATGRFATMAAAQLWVDLEHADADAMVTLYAASSGWRAQHAARRRDGGWA